MIKASFLFCYRTKHNKSNSPVLVDGGLNRTKFSRMDQVKFVEDSFQKSEVIWAAEADHITSNILKIKLKAFEVTLEFVSIFLEGAVKQFSDSNSSR